MQDRGAPVLVKLVLTSALLLALLLPAASSGQPRQPRASEAAKPQVTRNAGHGGWHVDLTKDANIRASGEYKTNVAVELESFSALSLEPSSTSKFEVFTIPNAPDVLGGEAAARVKGPRRQLVFEDSRPGLKPNPDGGPPFYTRADGAISALTWVEGQFGDVRVFGIVNTERGPEGKGSQSRQGLMARWDGGNNYYWFNIDFAKGEFAIVRSRYFGVFEMLPNSVGKITDFKNTKAYHMELEARGNSFRGRVFDKNKLVGDTGEVKDPKVPQLSGISGFLTELAIEAPYVPLEGSVTDLTSVALAARPVPAKRVTAAAAKSASDLAKRGASLSASGNARQAATTFEQALKADPRNVNALAGLAWIKATNKELRQPQEAVRLAERAFDGFFRAFSEAQTTGQPRVTGPDAVRVGLAISAAYASVGKFQPEVSRTRVEMTGLNNEQLGAMAASLEAAAGPYAQWTLEVARAQQRTNPSPENAQLVAQAEQLLAQVQKGQAPVQ